MLNKLSEKYSHFQKYYYGKVKKTNYLSTNLRKLLKNRGVSQAWLAEKLGKDRTSIGAYINEKSQPDLDITIKISTIFGVTLDDN